MKDVPKTNDTKLKVKSFIKAGAISPNHTRDVRK
jgi:hypothetical protein